MKTTLAALLVLALQSLAIARTSAAVEPAFPFAEIEVRFESVGTDQPTALQPCEVAQRLSTQTQPVAFWGTFGEARAHDGPGLEIVNTSSHCAVGAKNTAADSTPVPLVLLEVSAALKMDPGPMDPGPAPAAQLVLTLTLRKLMAFGADSRPQYEVAPPDRRVARVAAGEELVVPVILAGGAKDSGLGVREVLVRVQARLAVAAEYGSIEVVGAPAGAEILLDGNVAGKATTDGMLQIANVGIGERQVGVGREVRIATVVAGRTVALSFAGATRGLASAANLVRAGKNSQGFDEFRRSRDNAIMVFIPAGEYVMGNLETEGKPLPHTVYVSDFLIDKVAVTQERYRRFAAATGRVLPPVPYWGVREDHPAVFVRWDEARAYCEWSGGRLPTEAEREKAARGSDGRKYPWGNEEPTPERAVFRRNWGYVATDPVDAHPSGVSPYGLLNAGGNVWEFCEDWFDPKYFESSPPRDPMGPPTGQSRVVRGGSWDSRPSVLSSSARNFAYVGYREGDFGFRCAADPPRSR